MLLRNVPLRWDTNTIEALREWKRERFAAGATDNSRVIHLPARKKKTAIRKCQRRFKRCLKVLGQEKQRLFHCHSGRATFASVLAASKLPLKEIQCALRHSNLSITSDYVGLLNVDKTKRNLFSKVA